MIAKIPVKYKTKIIVVKMETMLVQDDQIITTQHKTASCNKRKIATTVHRNY